MITKSKARGASRKAGSIYVEVQFAPGRAAWVQIIKSDLWRALKDYPNDAEISGTIDANGDVWIGPSQGANSNNSRVSAQPSIEALFNRLNQLEQMVKGEDMEPRKGKRPSNLLGRGPVSKRGPMSPKESE